MTKSDRFVVEPLSRRHDRTAFRCGAPALDRYLRRQAGQDSRRGFARVFVATAADSKKVVGFYTLSAISVDADKLPQRLARKFPRYPVPCVLLGRFAVSHAVRGRGLERLLMVNATQRVVTASESIAIYALRVDAKDDDAKRFHEACGFSSLPSAPLRLFLPLARMRRGH